VNKYPFHLHIHYRDGKKQTKTFEALTACAAAAEALRPALVTSWSICVEIASRSLGEKQRVDGDLAKLPGLRGPKAPTVYTR